ncbi:MULTISPECIES: Gfo/Idh/MocA family protein [unclassified Streptomyces]|uniref:Gfo/Idh/MocA family protein n=1 Tax=unclassified Streptomyces TaxID=2593676 RepID=UPI003825F828
MGCGQIAQLMHLPYIAELNDRFEIVALCDRATDLARRVGSRYGVENIYGSLDEMLEKEPEIDAVLVLNLDHSDSVSAALRAGKHVFTEKPLGYTVAESEQAVKISEEVGKILMVGYMKRYDSGVRRGLEQIKRIARPVMARVHMVVGPEYGNWIIPELAGIDRSSSQNPERDARRDRVMDESKNMDQAALNAYMEMFGVWSHDINVYRAAFPEEPVSVKAHTTADGSALTAILQYADGFQCVFQGASTSLYRFEESLTVWGDDRTVSLDISNPFLRHIPSTVSVWRNETEPLPGHTRPATVEEVVTGSHREAFKSQLAHFHECVTSATPDPLTSGREALEDTRLMARIVKATMAEGR